ncbi:D-alanyl-D-alanine carboxypeptidase precursor [Legionella massiliensis]|uniref:D-alanyl-D-alanine carboxypeptidase n=1 Tax=Legionella massiliensis TaxID=1034943 RepID=A0A078L5E8_9GAMM|nr:serine hydrolase domain-containing protein [Legionella massiliensis]CDZ79314.1 D-alanyl-D-alanine carboxypeptidase precursor [Legionella massiliensis]CEE15052.1 D-alanyl-D-alanine carboxypeptidase precursor [Legionella massiliensis]
MAKIIRSLLLALVSYQSAQAADALRPINQEILQTIVSKTAKDFLVPGAFVLLRTPQGDYEVAYGTTEEGKTSSPNKNTHYRLASNTKTMTAAVILKQAQEGKLNLDDPVSKFIPEVPNGDKITIRDLLRMRSGLYNYTESPEFLAILDTEPNKAWTPEEVLSFAFKQPPYFKANAAFNYCNTNYVLLGLIAEKVEHKPLAAIMQERLFKPLNMSNTLLPAETSNTLPEPFSHGYQYGSATFALRDQPYPPEMQAAAKAGTLKPSDYTFLNPSYATAAGGAISTAHDLAIWIKALVSGKVFNADFQKQWLNSFMLESPDKPQGQSYGFGMNTIQFGPNKLYYHGGEIPGYNTFLGYDPVNKVTLIIWTNLNMSIDNQLTANTIMMRIVEQLYVVPPSQAKGASA